MEKNNHGDTENIEKHGELLGETLCKTPFNGACPEARRVVKKIESGISFV